MITIHERLLELREAVDIGQWAEAAEISANLCRSIEELRIADEHLDKDAFNNWFDIIGEAK
jgi:hypothetical protein|tara:strand:- start:141 stop:323 length:183 start_codon:yes stop_codon:yes gene_type:complete